MSCEKEEIGVQIDKTSLHHYTLFYLKSHIFELLQHTMEMEKNSTSRSGTTSNLYCLFGVTVIKLCQCWVPSQVDVTLRYSILLLPPFATSFLSYNSHRKHFLSCGFSLVFFALCKRFWFGEFVTLERLNKSWLLKCSSGHKRMVLGFWDLFLKNVLGITYEIVKY